jgi:hypothetical protein
MVQSSQIVGGRSRVSSILLLDKDKLLQSIFRLSSFLTAPSNVNEMLVKILDEVVDSIGFGDHPPVRRLQTESRGQGRQELQPRRGRAGLRSGPQHPSA